MRSLLHYFFYNVGVFLSEPEDLDAFPESNVSFPCKNNATNAPPHWRINANYFSRMTLPERYIFFDDTLRLLNVTIDDNDTTFQCLFILTTDVDDIIASRNATLHIRNGNYYYFYAC